MKIEAGKYYRNREGGIIGPMRMRVLPESLGSGYPFRAGNDSFTEEGVYCLGHESNRDLVSEALTIDREPSTGYPDDNPKTIYGLQKPGTSAIPPIAIVDLGRAMAFGAAKYGRFNWRKKRVTVSVYADAIDRHMLRWRDGEDVDPESGLPHLAHVMACCAILIDAESCGKLNDDRDKKGQVSRHIDALINCAKDMRQPIENT